MIKAIHNDTPNPTRPFVGWLHSIASHATAAMLGAAVVFGITVLPPVFTSSLGGILTAHVNSLKSGKLTEISASNTHNIRPWFSGKIEYAPTVIDLTKQGFNLTSARVDQISGKRVAVLIYKRSQHVINLFVKPDERTDDVITGTQNGYNYVV